jgi:hypothetical protein
LRNDLDDVASPVTEIEMTSAHGVEHVFRSVASTPMSKDNKLCVNGGADIAPLEFPTWLKIERRGDRAQALVSKDGNFWYPASRPAKIQFAKDEIVAGAFVCSHDDSALLTGTFDLASTDVSNTLLKPEQVSPSQPDPVVATAGDNSVLLTWDPVDHLGHPADGYTVYKAVNTSGSYEDLKFEKIADLAADKTSYVDDKAKTGEVDVYQVRTVVKIGDKTLESATISGRMLYVTAAPRPAIQIGNAAFNHIHLDGLGEGDISNSPGTSALDNGTLTLTASGRDFWERGDGGAGVFSKVSGNFTITAKLLGVPEAEGGGDAPDWAKTGLMIRESTEGESRMVGIYGTGGSHGLQAIRRAFTSGRGEDLGSTGDAQVYPVWLRLQRDGDKVNIFTSTDGTTFTPYESNASTTIPGLAKDLYVGVALTAHDNTVVAQAKFSDIKLDVTP